VLDTQAVSPAPYPWHRLRSAQYDQLYVSPHMDDAVYSCGGQLALERAAGKRILIVTVFGNGDDSPAALARGRGVFGDYTQRKREERAAADCLDVDHLWLNLPDLLVRKKSLADLLRYGVGFVELPGDALQAQLHATLTALTAQLLAADGSVFFPLAVGGHPDHRIVHSVARAFLTRQRGDVWFYEDMPYAQVRALRDERLQQLGLTRPHSWLGSTREVHDFVFTHAPRWQRPLTFLLLAAHGLLNRTLFALTRRGAATLEEGDLHERTIDSVIDKKVEAMRAYETQTAYFYAAGDALYKQLVRSGDHYVERYWRLRADARSSMDDERLAAQEHERAAQLVATLRG
jgi:LmbE family N-acetylglucosaminyl deacetylase